MHPASDFIYASVTPSKSLLATKVMQKELLLLYNKISRRSPEKRDVDVSVLYTYILGTLVECTHYIYEIRLNDS